MLAASLPMMADTSDAAGEPDLSIYRYTPKLTMTSENFGAVKYIVWDFGDGTVLDGRWEYFIEQQAAGEQLSSDIVAGIEQYRSLLQQYGNSLIVTTHTYASKGTYTATAVAMNPLGYVPEGGEAYDGVLYQDATGYNGGMGDPMSSDITAPTDSALESDSFKAVAGSWCRVTYVVEVKGYPTITFDTRGGSYIPPMEVENTFEYTAASMPADPTKSGSVFNGWFVDASCTQPYDWTSKVTADLTLYAGWSSDTADQYDHIITYMDGDIVLGTQNVRNSVNGAVTATITEDDPSKENKAFSGWVANTGDAPLRKGAAVSVPVAGLTLHAAWADAPAEHTHSIRYLPNGGTGSMPDSTILDGNAGTTLLTLAANGFSKTGYIFKGWMVDGQLKQPGIQIPVPDDIVIEAVAQWEAATSPIVTITVYVDGQATVFSNGQTLGDVIKPIIAGYRFDGWFTESDFRNQLSESTVLTDNLCIFSKMTRVQDDPVPASTVTVKVDGTDRTFEQGKRVSEISVPVRDGYTFQGWYSDQALSHQVAGSVVLTNGMTLYSKMAQSDTGDQSGSGDASILVYILIIVGIIVAIIGLLVHPVVLAIGIAIAAAGALELLGVIDLL